MKRVRIGALFAVTAIVFAACGGGTSSTAPSASVAPAPSTTGSAAAPSVEPSASTAGTPKAGGTLVVAIPGDLNRTDASLVDDANSSYVLQQVMEGLVTLEPGSGSKIVGQLAESWTISPDGLTYTFKLRTGVKFHDGTDFNAAAVKTNFDRWLKIPKTYVDLGYTYYIDTVIGRGATANVVEVTAPDPTTFVLKLRAPNSAFLVTMTLTPFTFSSPKALTDGKASDPDFKNNKYAQGGPPAAVGTGPFMFKEWVPGDHVTLVKNPDYWNKAAGGPYLDALTFKPIADTTATLNALQAGDVDISQTLAPVDVPTAQGDANLQYFDRGSACNVGVLAMNQKFKPFDNPKIRQAVAYAINRKAIVDAFFGETGVVLKNWAPPGTIFANDLAVPDYDVAKAKALIAESGVTDLAFDFWYPSDVSRPYMPDPKGEFEAMQRDLEAVGFKPNPKTSPWRPDYLAAESRGDYPAFLIGWNCDWLGIDNFLFTAFFGYRGDPLAPNPEYKYKNDAMNQAMVDALASSDEATQQADWTKAQEQIVADIPSVPIVSGKTPAAGRTFVKGFVPSPTLLELFTDVWLDK
ncbi:MAG: ABC transporter substrate-binding protein [Chloroflexota bacterium]